MALSPDWTLYRSFLAALQEGSLSAAARSLGLSQPSIGRHIDALEKTLGASLFSRSPEGLRPTALALQLQGPAEAMAAAVAQAARIASGAGQASRGTVRLTVSQIMGGEVLPVLLASYREQHPGVSIELVLSNANDDLLRGDADIAVRMVRPTQQALLTKRLGRVDIGLYAHRRYAKAHGLPASLLELAGHTLIGADRDPTIARLAAQSGFQVAREDFAFRTDSDLAQLAALRAGIGIGGCQVGIARRDPELLPVLPDAIRFSLDMWLVMHRDLQREAHVMSLFRFLSEALADYASSSTSGPPD
jgi:DNA-binding transcriptional LysR family regulator